MKWFVRCVQGLIVTTPLVLFVWLVAQEWVPSGVFVVERTAGQMSPFIDALLPDARVKGPLVDADGNTVETITGDPAFFFVHPHRSFETVEAEVWFKNHGVPIVELGGLANEQPEVYDLHPLQNLMIDKSSWLRLEEDGLVLLQRTPTYASVNDFLSHPPPRGEVATYQYTLTTPYRLEAYEPTYVSQSLDLSLRGSHEFKTYVKNETLSLDFAYMDMNRDEGADGINVVVFAEDGRLVGEARADDDGNVGDDQKATGLRHVILSVPQLPEGVYKVEWRVSRDIFLRTLTTSQSKLVFVNSLFLGDEVGYRETASPLTFWTEGKALAFSTRHAQGVQDVRIGALSLSVSEPYKRFSAESMEEGILPVTSPRRDMEIQTDAHVAFAIDMYFNPDPVRLRYNTDLDRLGVNYMIAEYSSPEVMGDWMVAHVTFDVDSLVLKDKTWKFVFSVSGVSETQTSLDVGRIRMNWYRDAVAWWDDVEPLIGVFRTKK
jgi:hypothetical protein